MSYNQITPIQETFTQDRAARNAKSTSEEVTLMIYTLLYVWHLVANKKIDGE